MKIVQDIKTSTGQERNVQHKNKIKPRCMHDIRTSTGRIRAIKTSTGNEDLKTNTG